MLCKLGNSPAAGRRLPINKTAGTYAACRENAEAKLAAGGAPSKYADALDKCETKFSARSRRTRPWRRARCVRAFPFMAQTEHLPIYREGGVRFLHLVRAGRREVRAHACR